MIFYFHRAKDSLREKACVGKILLLIFKQTYDDMDF